MADGYRAATIRRIAKEVGVSSTALYLHFPDKPAILREICERSLRAVIDGYAAIAVQPIDPLVRMVQIGEFYIRWALEHPNAYRLVYIESRVGAEMWTQENADLSYQAFFIYLELVRELAAAGRLRSDEPDAVAQATWMAVHGVIAMLIARPHFNWAEPNVLLAVLVQSLLEGMVKA